jgi:hypothetical protein
MSELIESIIDLVVGTDIGLLGIIIGALITLLGVYFNNFLNIRQENRKIKREKLEEAFKEILKIEIFVGSMITAHLSIIKGLETKKLPFQHEAIQELLKMLLSLYSNEFKEDIEELDNALRKYRDDNFEIVRLINQKSQEEIANMAFDAGSELLNVCKNMKNKINTIFEKDYK